METPEKVVKSYPFTKVAFFDTDETLLFERDLDDKGSVNFPFVLKELPSCSAANQNTDEPFAAIFPAVKEFTSEGSFTKALKGTILRPLNTNKTVYLMINGIDRKCYGVQILVVE